MNTDLDHLVVLAHSLAQGVAWCEAELGVAPGPGGQHTLMGTHNRLLRIDSPAYPQAYLEVLAIDPDAPPPTRPRWFGLDEPALQQRLRVQPLLAHAVLRTSHVEMLRWGLINLGQVPGEPLALTRATPQGPLQWRMLVRPDGAIAAHGCLPTLIEWTGIHPTAAMPAAPVRLQLLQLGGLPLPLRNLLRLRGASWADAPEAPALAVALHTPRGLVHWASPARTPGLDDPTP